MIVNLGKILLILCLPYIIYAKVNLKAQDSFFKGEEVVFSITATGGNIEFPDIKNIDGFLLQGAGTSNQTTIINGVRNQSLTKNYAFLPTKDVTIPSFEIKVNGDIEKTKSKTIKMQQVKKTSSKYYDLTIDIDKKDVYVGEEIRFTLKFKYRKDLQIVSLDFAKPQFENFWVKELQSDARQNSKGQFVEQELNYLLFPQKSGKISIDPLKIGVVVVDDRFRGSGYGFFGTGATKTIPVYSNVLNLDVKALPDNTNIIGDFEIFSTIDKTKINAGEAVAYKVIIKGRGNIDDIDEIKLDILNATIYDNPLKKEIDFTNGRYGGTYTKTYSIVAQNNFTIPSISLKYFDKKSLTVKTVKTKSYDIKVNSLPKKETKLQVLDAPKSKTLIKEKVVTKVVKTSDNEKIIFFLLGMLVSVIFISLFFIFKNKNKKENKEEISLVKLVKKSNSSQELLKILVVYINIDEQLDSIIYSLENNNANNNLKKLKKEILNILKDKVLEVKV